VATAAEDDGTVGFLVAGLVPPEAELETIAVSGALQGQGIGKLLLLELVEKLRGDGINVVHLEVRASNDRALGFYRAMGFRESGRRPRYYADPEEDAVLMALDLPAASRA
jgi:ribosomal-protein-alanine N-acetyltransferase